MTTKKEIEIIKNTGCNSHIEMEIKSIKNKIIVEQIREDSINKLRRNLRC